MVIYVYIQLMNSLITKGAIIVMVAVVSAFSGYVYATKKHTCPDCVCPTVKIPPCPTPEIQSMDFKKLKNFKGNINQVYQVKADSSVLAAFNKSLEAVLDKKLKELKLSRCK